MALVWLPSQGFRWLLHCWGLKRAPLEELRLVLRSVLGPAESVGCCVIALVKHYSFYSLEAGCDTIILHQLARDCNTPQERRPFQHDGFTESSRTNRSLACFLCRLHT